MRILGYILVKRESIRNPNYQTFECPNQITMNPLHPSDELCFQITTDKYYSLPIQTTPFQNQILYDPVKDGSALIPCTGQMETTKGKQRGKLPAWRNEDYKITTIDENKKWMHRETEKQRRQEMTRLCTDFRSLLPLEYIKVNTAAIHGYFYHLCMSSIFHLVNSHWRALLCISMLIILHLDDHHQGKRSISDHMHEGTKYIKHLENKVKQLQAKRDQFKELSNLSPVVSDSGSFNTTHLPICVIVHPFVGGVQIKCSYSFRQYAFPLSRVIDMVLKEGLDVVNCTSTKTDDRFIHTVRLEVPYQLIIWSYQWACMAYYDVFSSNFDHCCFFTICLEGSTYDDRD